MDSASILGIVQSVEGIPGMLGSLLGFIKPTGKGAGPVHFQAVGAYVSFEESATSYMVNLALVAEIGVPPSVVGGFWTWPLIYRAHRHMAEAAVQIVQSFGQIVMLGSPDVAQAAYEYGLALADAGKALKVTKRRLQASDEFRNKLEVAGRALRAYILAARKSLELPPPQP